MIRSLSGSRFSRHQFAFLLCLIECFPEKLTPTIIYDPEFNQEDEKIIGRDETMKIFVFSYAMFSTLSNTFFNSEILNKVNFYQKVKYVM